MHVGQQVALSAIYIRLACTLKPGLPSIRPSSITFYRADLQDTTQVSAVGIRLVLHFGCSATPINQSVGSRSR